MSIEPTNNQGEKIELSQDFNSPDMQAEQSLQDRISGYDLNKDEISQIRSIVNDRDKAIEKETQDYENDWDERYENELNRLMEEAQPDYDSPEHNYNPPERLTNTPEPSMGGTNNTNNYRLYFQAQRNVHDNHINTLNDIKQDANNQIDSTLDQAKEDGRGPTLENQQEQNQEKSLTQEFNQNR